MSEPHWESVYSEPGPGTFDGWKFKRAKWFVSLYAEGPEWGDLSGTCWVTDRETGRSREVSGLLERIRRRASGPGPGRPPG